MKTVERERLYEQVWSTPLTTLCRSYGLNYAGLRRLCDELNIPIPQRGHWARVAAGEAYTKPELPALEAAVQAIPAKPRAAGPRKPAVATSSAEPLPRPSDAPLHHIITPLQRLYEDAEKEALAGKAEFDWEQAHPRRRYRNANPVMRSFNWEGFCNGGEILLPTGKKSVLKVSIGTYRRALRLLSDLAFSMEGAGFVIKLTKKNERLEASRSGALVLVRISEKLETNYKSVTNSWSDSVYQEQVLSPTGRLSIHVETECTAGSRFWDSKSGLLEKQWSRILGGVELQHANSTRWRAEIAERAKAYEEARRLLQLEEQRQAVIRAREEAEAKLRLQLVQEAERWKSADQIREYVSHLVAGASTVGCSGSEFDAWVAWAKEVADQLDPSVARLWSCQTKPETDDA